LLETEPGIELRFRALSGPGDGEKPARAWLLVSTNLESETVPDWLKGALHEDDALYLCRPRGIGETQWTRKNPPNYVERSHALLGRTVDTGRVWDVIAVARYIRQKNQWQVPVTLAGEGSAAVLAGYAALLESDIAAVVLRDPVLSHMNAAAPQFLNVLRVCDVPDMLGMLAPRPLTIRDGHSPDFKKVEGIYSAAGVADHVALP
jgi:hypothetical protein